jgi:hypothetical protein
MKVDRTIQRASDALAMSSRTPPATIRSGAPIATRTRTLLAAGILAGPLFLAVGLVHAFTREGFDLGRHPLSRPGGTRPSPGVLRLRPGPRFIREDRPRHGSRRHGATPRSQRRS